MKTKSVVFTAAILLASAVALPVGAATDYAALVGDPAPVSAAPREIRIEPSTKYVNVEGGEVVKFDVGAKSFAWNFDVGQSTSNFDLNEVAPKGLLGHPVTVYIAPDPRWL
jgi:hypothetical protein